MNLFSIDIEVVVDARQAGTNDSLCVTENKQIAK
jgi:hypothetical protein